MRNCIYCGMPMEDDDLFCTRCGKKVPADKAGENIEEKTAAAVKPGKSITAATAVGPGKGIPAAAAEPGRTISAAAAEPGPEAGPEAGSAKRPGRGMSYEFDPQDDDDDEYGDGRRFDRTTIIMLSAAAVLLVILGVLLFNIMHLSSPGKNSGSDNEVAVYDDKNSQEQNLNQGQQTPASGSAADTSEQTPAEDQGAYSEARDSSQQIDPPAAAAPETNTDAAEEQKKAEQQKAEEEAAQTPPQETPAEAEDQYTNEEDYADEGDGEYGWVIDEDGNEVYYPREDEEYYGNDQTGGVSQQSIPETDDAGSESGVQDFGSDAVGLDAGAAADDSGYILAQSNSRVYTSEELSGLDDNTLQMAINEIYARHGRKFNTQSMQEYFNGKSWYSGTVEPEAFDGNEAAYFNEYELKNRELLAAIRAKRQQAAGAAGQLSQ